MNVFWLSDEPGQAARAHCDQHCGKMVLESAQLAAGALLNSGVDPLNYPELYADAHPHGHPCKTWAMATRSNFLWLIELGLALGEEWVWRGFKPHASVKQLYYCQDLAGAIIAGPLTPPALAMPPEFWRPDPIEAYRNYYCGTKAWFKVVRRVNGVKTTTWEPARWTHREPPEWWHPYQEQPQSKSEENADGDLFS